MFNCERCGVNSADGFIMPDGKWLCTPCAMLKDNVDQNSLSAVSQAKTEQGKIDVGRNCNGVHETLPETETSVIREPEEKTMDETMAAKTALVADFIRQEGVGPNEHSEFGLGLAVALLLQLSTTEQIKYALATIKEGYS